MQIKLYSYDGKEEKLAVSAVCFSDSCVSYTVGDITTGGHTEILHYSKDGKNGLNYACVVD